MRCLATREPKQKLLKHHIKMLTVTNSYFGLPCVALLIAIVMSCLVHPKWQSEHVILPLALRHPNQLLQKALPMPADKSYRILQWIWSHRNAIQTMHLKSFDSFRIVAFLCASLLRNLEERGPWVNSFSFFRCKETCFSPVFWKLPISWLQNAGRLCSAWQVQTGHVQRPRGHVTMMSQWCHVQRTKNKIPRPRPCCKGGLGGDEKRTEKLWLENKA